MSAYETFRPADVPWINMIPTHWETKRLKELLAERKESNNPVKTTDILSLTNTRGVIPYAQKGNIGNKSKENLENYKLAYPNDLVLNSMNVIIGSVGLSQYFGAVSPVYYMLYPRKNDNIRYFEYIFKLKTIQEYLKGLGNGILAIRMRIPMIKLNNVLLPVPPREEQDHIVRYLDWQVSKINKLIAAKKKEIAVLEEYKQTAIDEAVTKGISNHDFVTSNVDWIEQIPSSWKLKKIKEYFSFGKGLSITKANLVEEGIPVISYGQVHSKRNTGVKVEQHLLRYVPDTYLELSPNALVNKGDFIFADTSEDYLGVGNCVYIDVTNTLFAGYHTIIARSKHNENGKFFAYLFRSSAWRYQIRKRVNGVKVYSITQKILGTASVLIPPKNEQAEIVEYLDDICGRVDAIIENLYKRIDIFHEYRTRLISDVVTGQIDVRGIEIPDYEYVEEESDEETDETEGADEEVEEQEE
jgi:type I restriction enzyme S subunit